MIVPSSRLMLWTAAGLLPAAVASFATPGLGWLLPVAAGALAVAALADAVRARGLLAGLGLAAPPVVRLARDQEGAIPLRVTGVTRPLPRVRIGLALPADLGAAQEALDTALPEAGRDHLLPWPCHPRRRGRHAGAGGAFETASPLGLWTVRRRVALAADLRVYPNLREERRRVAALFLRRGGPGAHRMRQVGKGREFEKLRDYIPGDGYEDIHWKATARRRHPVTKVYQIERTQEVYVVVDSSRLSGRPAGGAEDAAPDVPPPTVLDRFLASGLTLALAAQANGDLFGFVEFNSRVRTFLRAGRGKGHFDACRNALFALESGRMSPDYAELFSFVRTRLRKRALLVVLTSLDDSVLAEQFLRGVELVQRQHLVTVHMLRPPGARPLFAGEPPADVAAIYRELEGHESWRRLEETGRALRRRGVHFAQFERERLSAELVSQYMTLKGQQRL